MNRKILCQPLGFGQARLELEMFAFERAAQFSSNEDRIAWFRSGPQESFAARHRADERNGDQNALGIRGGFPSGNGNPIALRQSIDALINRFDEFEIKV